LSGNATFPPKPGGSLSWGFLGFLVWGPFFLGPSFLVVKGPPPGEFSRPQNSPETSAAGPLKKCFGSSELKCRRSRYWAFVWGGIPPPAQAPGGGMKRCNPPGWKKRKKIPQARTTFPRPAPGSRFFWPAVGAPGGFPLGVFKGPGGGNGF